MSEFQQVSASTQIFERFTHTVTTYNLLTTIYALGCEYAINFEFHFVGMY